MSAHTDDCRCVQCFEALRERAEKAELDAKLTAEKHAGIIAKQLMAESRLRHAKEIIKAKDEALLKAQVLYEAANRSLEDTDEDPPEERKMEMAQVYTLRSGWARLCDSVDEIDVNAPGFKEALALRLDVAEEKKP